MQQMVEDIPDELGVVFEKTLETVRSRQPMESQQMLEWILCVARPITLAELRYALAFQDTKYKSQAEAESSLSLIESDHQMSLFVKARTVGLTESRIHTVIKTAYAWQFFDRSNKPAMHFVHGTVKIFLLNRGGLELIAAFPAPEALRRGHRHITESCINCLNTAELRLVVQTNTEPLVLGRMEEAFPVWRYLSDLDHKTCFHKPHGTKATLIHLAAEHDMTKCVEHYLTQGGDINVVGGRFGTLIQAAAAMGGGNYGNPLQTAASSSYCSVKLIATLLDVGANINEKFGRHGASLQAGAYKGDEAVFRTLLQHGTNVNMSCGEHGTA
ncbi:hypothetical protein B0J13DRAFT_627808 [Dactylonectria estremocensis]|uniref:Ankyrin n=1 Tax=Dactylonectria estremocensis TaxID=1079267 RepID=A0A9P9DXD2_9HYPO|nr:hypothetical protein B0J13DRAFT_627808 [Dactylonectria estremocensis]